MHHFACLGIDVEVDTESLALVVEAGRNLPIMLGFHEVSGIDMKILRFVSKMI